MKQSFLLLPLLLSINSTHAMFRALVRPAIATPRRLLHSSAFTDYTKPEIRLGLILQQQEAQIHALEIIQKRLDALEQQQKENAQKASKASDQMRSDLFVIKDLTKQAAKKSS